MTVYFMREGPLHNDARENLQGPLDLKSKGSAMQWGGQCRGPEEHT